MTEGDGNSYQVQLLFDRVVHERRNNAILLKMLFFDEGSAFVSSANISHAGLGLDREVLNEILI